jgi:hypothetical protein
MTDFTMKGWKIGKEIPTWVLGYDDWVNDVPILSRYYPVNGNSESMHGYDTEVVNVNDPDDTDSVVVGDAHDNMDEAVEDDIEAQYSDVPKDNDTDSQDEQENWSEPEDSDGDAKREGTVVQGEEVT